MMGMKLFWAVVLLSLIVLGILMTDQALLSVHAEEDKRTGCKRLFTNKDLIKWCIDSWSSDRIATENEIKEERIRLMRQEEQSELRAREKFIQAHPDLSERIKRAIREKKVILGMTKDAVRASLGYPCNVNTDVGNWGVHEQWIYGGRRRDDCFGRPYLYFTNGILSAWQN